jgi:opacity protein-like surface antigen
MDSRWIAVLSIAALPALAGAGELAEGTLELSGSTSVGFSTGGFEDTVRISGWPDQVRKVSSTDAGVGGGALYYLIPNVGVGIDLQYGKAVDEEGTETFTRTTRAIGPRFGMDLGITEEVSAFGDAALVFVKWGYRLEDTALPSSNYDEEYTGFGVRAAAGLKYFPTPALSLNAGVRYVAVKVTGTPVPGVERTMATNDLGVVVGLSVYLGR